MLTINSNVPSLNAQRNLSGSQSALSTSLQRLSSGLRINSAKDDAAGLAISERMSSQIRGLDQARRNSNDGISMAQTAEGALGEIGNNLQRMRELAVQAANGTNSASDRDSLQAEVLQLRNEIDRVANQTKFNGTALLDGSTGGLTFQVGAEANQVISITSLTSAKSNDLGSSTYASATGTVRTKLSMAAGVDLSAAAGAAGATSLAVGGFKINGFDIKGADLKVADNTKVTYEEGKKFFSQTVDAINAASGDTGVTAQLDVAANGDLSISMNSESTIAVTAGAETGTEVGLNVVTGAAAATGLKQTNVGFNDVDVSSISNANKAMVQLDAAIDAVNTMRGDLGAVQNRFQSTITNLQTSSENLSASRGRIQDTDFAAETAKLSRNQVLQQAGTAMLAQANQLPQNVLSLLR